jgi:hypothetical protein
VYPKGLQVNKVFGAGEPEVQKSCPFKRSNLVRVSLYKLGALAKFFMADLYT